MDTEYILTSNLTGLRNIMTKQKANPHMAAGEMNSMSRSSANTSLTDTQCNAPAMDATELHWITPRIGALDRCPQGQRLITHRTEEDGRVSLHAFQK